MQRNRTIPFFGFRIAITQGKKSFMFCPRSSNASLSACPCLCSCRWYAPLFMLRRLRPIPTWVTRITPIHDHLQRRQPAAGITAYFYSVSAADTDTISIFDATTGTFLSPQGVFNNQAPVTVGSSVTFTSPSLHNGDTLVFDLYNTSFPGDVFSSNPATSPDGDSHAYFAAFSGTIGAYGTINGTYVGMEDLPVQSIGLGLQRRHLRLHQCQCQPPRPNPAPSPCSEPVSSALPVPFVASLPANQSPDTPENVGSHVAFFSRVLRQRSLGSSGWLLQPHSLPPRLFALYPTGIYTEREH